MAQVPSHHAVPVPAGLRLRRQRRLRSRATRGDTAAFTALYERHHQELYRFCRSILRHEEDARDAVQNAMTKAFAALQGEERDFELRPWLFRIAHNEAVSILRARRPTEDLDAAHELGHDPLPQTLSDRERLAHLRTDLLDLPERQRAALVLRELSGLGHEEIAGVLGATPRSVKQTIFEARAALHECAEGRAMDCEPVQRALSDGDGRVLKGRRLRAHLRSCSSCRAFRNALQQRPADLAVLAPPLPVAAAAAVAAQVLGAGATGGAVGGAAAGAAGATGGGLLAGVGSKAAAVAVVATVAGGATATQLPQRHADPAPPRTQQAAPAAAPSVTRSAPASVPTAPRSAAAQDRATPRTSPARPEARSSQAAATPAAKAAGRTAKPAGTGPPSHANGIGQAAGRGTERNAARRAQREAARGAGPRIGKPRKSAKSSKPRKPATQPSAPAVKKPKPEHPSTPDASKGKPAQVLPDPGPPAALQPPEAKASPGKRNPS